ncbi:aldehyde dehydrogenase [Devosia lacusdianchii]|uniref:aldehyde dehydrogenase n=1 Tax=Devosia lacusdianchii TaxID=2917991 RepID=UPI001F068EAE|nr:aldehyde dehydrogenase [Devosia sp. JXJ CY 41]
MTESARVGDRDYWHALAGSVALPNQAVIGGQQVDARSGKRFATINPATGALLTDIAEGDAADIDAAVAAARRSFDAGHWRNQSPLARKQVLLRLAELMRAEQQQLAAMESLDMGKLVRDASGNDIPTAINILQWHAEEIDKVYDEVAPLPPGNIGLIRRVPLGVVGAVVPWNFPLNMAVWKCAPALAAGNSVVLKPAEQSPLTALRFAQLALEAGLPEGVLNVVPGFGETAGQALGRHMDVDCLAFTGSTAVGKMFLRYAGDSNLKQVWLECGGKSPVVVFEDCEDLETAADQVASGIFYNQGQVCSAGSRLIVQNSIRTKFLDLLTARLSQYQPGDPLDPRSGLGAMVEARHAANVMRYVEAGRREATLVAGGNAVQVDGSGSFIEPTIFADVHPDAVIAREEIFGPVLAVLGFSDEDKAIALANDSIYGLGASLWTDNLSRAHRVSEQLVAGVVGVNVVDPINPAVPFGGFRQSGSGRDLSRHAVEKYTALKTTWIRFKN